MICASWKDSKYRHDSVKTRRRLASVVSTFLGSGERLSTVNLFTKIKILSLTSRDCRVECTDAASCCAGQDIISSNGGYFTEPPRVISPCFKASGRDLRAAFTYKFTAHSVLMFDWLSVPSLVSPVHSGTIEYSGCWNRQYPPHPPTHTHHFKKILKDSDGKRRHQSESVGTSDVGDNKIMTWQAVHSFLWMSYSVIT